MARVTLRQVASAAHVSIATASIALRGKPGVSDETRALVMATADRMGYHPNAGARSLRQGYRPVIGVLLDPLLLEGDQDSDAQFVRRFVTGLGRQAATQGASVVMLDPGGDAAEFDVLVWIRLGKDVRPPIQLTRGTPVVNVTANSRDHRQAGLSHDFDAMTTAVLDALTQQEASRPALIRIRSDAAFLNSFEESYRAWCHSIGVPAGVFVYEPNEESAVSVGQAVVDEDFDAAFLTSGRFRPLVVGGLLKAVPNKGDRLPLALLAESRPVGLPVGGVLCLSLEGESTAEVVIREAISANDAGSHDGSVGLPWRLRST